MASSRDLKDDALFLGALVALLLGLGLLFETTGLLRLPEWGLPIALLALAGIFLWLCMVRGRSGIFLGAGVSLGLAGLVFLAAAMGAGIARLWPFLMASAGFGLLAYGARRFSGPRAGIVVPSASLILLALFFSLFSLHILTVSLAAFVAAWWPLLFIIGGISMFLAWSFRTRRERAKRRLDES